MNDLVDSVKGAVKDADAATDRRQVVDLGQSLHLLETKFSGLRNALAEELGASKHKLSSQSTAASDIMDRSTDLVKGVISQREELRQLASDLRETDSAIRALKDSLHNFDEEMKDLNDIMGDVHHKHVSISNSNDRLKYRLGAVTHEYRAGKRLPLLHKALIALIFVEAIAIVVFIYLKLAGRPSARKPYGKFG